MLITFLIPVFNGEKIIGEAIDSILDQKFERGKIKIIVVDDGSTDNTLEVVKNFPKIKIIRKKHTGLGDTRNVALKHAKGDYIVFLDCDVILKKNWLNEIFKNTDFDKYCGATGYVELYNKNESIVEAMREDIRKKRFSDKKQIFSFKNFKIQTFAYIFRTDIFKKVGNFDPMFKTNGEDFDWFFRCFYLGNKILYVPSAKAIHKHPKLTFFGWLKKQTRTSKAFVSYLKNPFTPKKYVLLQYFKILFFPFIFLLFFINWKIAILLFFIGLLEEAIRGAKSLKNKKYLPLLLLGRLFSLFGQIKSCLSYLLFKKI